MRTNCSKYFFIFAPITCIILMLSLGIAWHAYFKTTQKTPAIHVIVWGPFRQISTQSFAASVRPYLQQAHPTLQGLQYTLLAKLPWLDHIALTKKWPDVYTLHFTEKKPIAIWHHKMINAQDTLLPTTHQPLILPRLFGQKKDLPTMLTELATFQTLLTPLKWRISSLRLIQGDWQMTLAQGPVIFLGHEAMLIRLTRLMQVYPQLLQAAHKKTIQSIALQYPHGLAVAYQPPKPDHHRQ